ncbi:hypothetical protein ACOSQ4_012385 [Xanthoceras sorbifolium]
MHDNSFPIDFKQVKHSALMSKHDEYSIWHKRLGHFNFDALNYLQKHDMKLLKWQNGRVQCRRS